MVPQSQILEMSKALFESLPKLLDKFHIQYQKLENRFIFPCPVHNGDNPEGCCIFTDGENTKGNWVCWTHGCHEEYGNYILGLLQGILSCRNDEAVGFRQTLDCAMSIIGNKEFTVSNEQYKTSEEEKLLKVFTKTVPNYELPNISRETITSRLNIPSPYYLGTLTNTNIKKRRVYYDAEVLKRYDVGDCMEPDKPMSYRAVVPFYNEAGLYIGCTGRKIYENNDYKKWLNSKNLKNSHILYGLHLAKEYIPTTLTLGLVEGQGDVWRAVSAGMANCVGIMGANLSDSQLLLLEQSGVQNLVIMTDYDSAGNIAYKQIERKCGRRFNIHRPELPNELYEKMDKVDIGEMFDEEVKEYILEKLPRGFKCQRY